jgi:hypothetical protein
MMVLTKPLLRQKKGATVLSHNKGVGGFQSIINYTLQANKRCLGSIDADGQFDINQIPEMLAPF